MSQYYYLVASLPPLHFDVPPDLAYQEFCESLSMNLSKKDLKAFRLLLQPIDLYNVKALWLGFPLDDRGTFSAKELEEALLLRDGIPEYLAEYLERHESTEERLRYFPALYAAMYHQPFSGFLQKYFSFDRELRLVLSALRAKQLGRDFLRTFQFEDPKDPFVAEILSQKDAPEYIPPREYEDLREIYLKESARPEKLHREISKYRFDKIGQFVEMEAFTLDRLLAYAARLVILEGFADFDKEKARAIVDGL